MLVHANYSSNTYLNDVALLYFATQFTFTSAVGSLSLPPQGTAFGDGLICTVSGWGTTQSGTRPTPEQKETLARLSYSEFSLDYFSSIPLINMVHKYVIYT